jgi:shikimate dehydrogenase
MTSPALQEIIALLGCPAAGNPAQYLFERAIEAAELDWRFVTCDVASADVAAAVCGVAALGFRGCLLSGPLREAALPFVTTASPAATFSGGLSLIERRPDGLVGHMTDGRGLVEALRSHVDPAGSRALVVGADACGRAAALELAVAGAAEIVVCDSDEPRARSLADSLAGLQAATATVLGWQPRIDVPETVGVVVFAPFAGPVPTFAGLRADLVVADASLASRLSPAAAQAAEYGGCIVDGIEIHAAQTAIDFHALTGIEPDADMLREALEEFLS